MNNEASCRCSPTKRGFVPEDPSRRGPDIGGLPTNNGWWVCSNCRLPSLHALNDCESCGKKFKGIRPGIKFAYPCPECE